MDALGFTDIERLRGHAGVDGARATSAPMLKVWTLINRSKHTCVIPANVRPGVPTRQF